MFLCVIFIQFGGEQRRYNVCVARSPNLLSSAMTTIQYCFPGISQTPCISMETQIAPSILVYKQIEVVWLYLGKKEEHFATLIRVSTRRVISVQTHLIGRVNGIPGRCRILLPSVWQTRWKTWSFVLQAAAENRPLLPSLNPLKTFLPQ